MVVPCLRVLKQQQHGDCGPAHSMVMPAVVLKVERYVSDNIRLFASHYSRRSCTRLG